MRAIERELLHGARRREQKEQKCGFAPGPDGHRARRHREHQEVDLELGAAEILPGVLCGVPSPRQDRKKIQPAGDPRCLAPEVAANECRQPKPAAGRRERRKFLPLGFRRRPGPACLGPRVFPPEPELLRGGACFPHDLGRRSLLPQHITVGHGAHTPAGPDLQPGLDRGNRLRHARLHRRGIDVADRGDGQSFPGGIHPDCADLGLVMEEGHQLLDPRNRLRFLRHAANLEVARNRLPLVARLVSLSTGPGH